MVDVDKSFTSITPDDFVKRIEDVEVKRIFNRDDNYDEILTLKFIYEKIDKLDHKNK